MSEDVSNGVDENFPHLVLEKEARNLAERFTGVNRAAFIRDHKIKGGQSMVYQHITGRRPISLASALAYAAGFGVGLEEISLRLANEATTAAAVIGTPAGSMPLVPNAPPGSVNVEEITELVSLYANSSAGQRKAVIDLLRKGAGQGPL